MPRNNRRGSPWWQGQLRGCGLRVTLGRKAILDVLTRAEKHLSAEDIYMRVHPLCPSVGLTTVYRTLEVLVNMGLVNKMVFGDGRAWYELAAGPRKERHHHHLICTKCKRVIDYTDFIDEELEFLKKAEKGLSKKYHFDITNHEIQFNGLCEKCRSS